MKDQVLSIEKMQHLREMGIDTSEASAVLMLYSEDGWELEWKEVKNHGRDKPLYKWYDDQMETWELAYVRIYDAELGNYDHSYRKECGAFTLQDMLGLFPILYFYEGGMHTNPPLDVSTSYETLYPSLHFMGEWEFAYRNDNGEAYGSSFVGSDVMEVCCKGLCWLAENKLLGKEEKK